jgi:ABC-type transporter Mla MlaB component
VGIFSLFGKKDDRPAKPADKDASRSKRAATRPPTVKRDAEVALATAKKIDAIESEMSSEFVNVTTAPPRRTAASSAPAPTEKPKQEAEPALAPATGDMGSTTEFLLGGQSAVGDIASPSSEAAAVIEEAAILYANGQGTLVQQMLMAAIAADDLGDATMNAWLMLLDLYQIAGKQQEFEQLAIEYASRFETSPPAWRSAVAPSHAPSSGAAPTVPFSGKLDSRCSKQIERLQTLAESHRTLRLEFARVTHAEPAGCSLLLGLLRKLQKSGHDLVLVGAPELAEKIRAILEVGRRDDSEDAWLLLLEILRLLNREKEFEEVSIDYCITFEVSPPAFVAPQNKVTTAAVETAAPESEGFMMPALIEGRIDDLIVAIAAYSDDHQPAIIDCSRLNRIDFNAAGRLLSGLGPFCGNGKQIEFHHVNHLIVELFGVIGLKDIVRIIPRKN